MAERPSPEPDGDDTYRGWASHETWAAHLWLTGADRGTYHQAMRLVEEAGSDQSGAEALRTWIERANPLAGEASLFSDLLSRALLAIDWEEVAASLVEEEHTDRV